MPNKYRLIAIEPALYEVWKNDNTTPIFSSFLEEKCKEYIKFNKKQDREYTILNKSFEISSICKEDLIEYIGKEQVLKLNNNQMKNIARLMGDYHMNTYWDNLTDILESLDIKLPENHEE